MSLRVLAIGDIHGQLGQFDALLDAIALTPDDHLVLLGDYVDRGPHSAGVLNRIMQLRNKCKLSAIKGNHEEMMLAARGGRLDLLREWTFNGGDKTLESYAGQRATIKDVLPEHWKFLESGLVEYVETDTHIFVHANCYPDHAMADQPDFMLRWERCDQISPHQSGKVIVCGHTPQKSGRPMNKGFAICLDTGAGFKRPLTGMDVTSGKIWQAHHAGNVTRAHITDFADDTTDDE